MEKRLGTVPAAPRCALEDQMPAGTGLESEKGK